MAEPSAAGGGSARPSSAEQAKAAQQATAYFVSRGWTPAQAAGIAANLQQESGFNAAAVGDNGRALGIAQWHADRQKAIEQHFGKSLSQMSTREQFDAVNWELRSGSEQQAGRRLALTTSARDAGAAVSQFYERPGDVAGEQNRRGRHGRCDRVPLRKRCSRTGGDHAGTHQPGLRRRRRLWPGDGAPSARQSAAGRLPGSITDTSGSLSGARVAQANVMATLP